MNLGLKPCEFWEMRFVDYMRYVIYKAKEDANEWDKFRVLYSMILNTSVSKKSDQKKPKEMLPLWTDKLVILKKKPVKIPTEQEKKEMLERVGK